MSEKLNSLKEDYNTARGVVASLTESHVVHNMRLMPQGAKAEVRIRRFMREHNWTPADEFIENKFKEWDSLNWELTSGYPETTPPEWITGTIIHMFTSDPHGNYKDGYPVLEVPMQFIWTNSEEFGAGVYMLYPFQIMDIRPVVYTQS